GMSCVLVPAVGAVHVPVSRRRLLRQRRARLGSAAARPVSVRLGSAQRRTFRPGAPLPDLAGHATRGRQGQSVREGLTMTRYLRAVAGWLDARLKVRESILPMLTHPIPKGAAGPMGWWYVFGSASLTMLLIQIVTGIGLALVYVPAADKAYES